MSHIFLSYARDDVEAAKRLAEGISQAGHDVWWDRNLHAGSRFTEEIDRALKEAEAVIVLWSETSVGSAWVQDESGGGPRFRTSSPRHAWFRKATTGLSSIPHR